MSQQPPHHVQLARPEVCHGSTQGRRFCFTLNNPTDGERELISNTSEGEILRMLVVGDEVGEEGTPHLQGYLEVSKRMRFGPLRAQFNWLERAALFVCKGSRRANLAYCTKEKLFHATREARRALEGCSDRTDLDAVRGAIDDGISMLEVAQSHWKQYVRYRRSFEAYETLVKRSRNEVRPELECTLLWGPTGSGKTRTVFEKEKDLWIWSAGTWFDGYHGQEAVLFDDFRGGLPLGFFLRVLDIYPIDVPVKGGFVAWTPKRVYVTSNRSYERWYDSSIVDDADVAALKRRFKEIRFIELN